MVSACGIGDAPAWLSLPPPHTPRSDRRAHYSRPPAQGNALREAGRTEEAVACYTSCIHLQMAAAQAPLLAAGRMGLGSAAQAAAQQHAQRLSVAYNNLAGILKMTGRLAECTQCYEHVVYLQVGMKRRGVRGGGLCGRQGLPQGTASGPALPYPPRPRPHRPPPPPQPQSPEAYANLASAVKDCGRHDEAIGSYRQALALRPDFPEAFANYVHSLQCVCDWQDRPALFARWVAAARAPGAGCLGVGPRRQRVLHQRLRRRVPATPPAPPTAQAGG